MAEQTNKDFEALRRDFDALRADMQTLTGSLREQAGQRVERAKADARDTGERLQRQAQQVREVVGGQLEDRPVTALLSAFAVGMALGALLGRKA